MILGFQKEKNDEKKQEKKRGVEVGKGDKEENI